ncbi:hypothetical protein NP493_186g00005 [Ridgeia piscesae]|uniref:glutathione gamma-glutamylcysteinyltransferase n=1 Tax=Ridgeia piscesae TaxID=27915 RepID=A0AAD9P2J1_RIDPI|nr:hypothetical protein NP493_186g00005 [Ridgeia piscesae]
MSRLVDLASPEGQSLLVEVKQDDIFYHPCIEQVFSKQISRRNCALQSAAILLNAFYLATLSPASSHTNGSTDIPKCTAAGQLPFAEERMLEAKGARDVTSLEKVDARGATLDEMCRIMAAHGCQAERHYATESSVESFREKCKSALGTSHGGVIVNYHMATLGQGTFGGHHSPLGAYHPREDRFLLWDTWPDTQVCWARTDDLFRAMDTVDTQSNASRGFCIVYNCTYPEQQTGH